MCSSPTKAFNARLFIVGKVLLLVNLGVILP
jgi:hypothetical protein